MSRFEFSLQARADLQEIEDYISRDNPDAAGRLLLTIDEKCQLLARHPGIGLERSELRPRLRSFAVGNHVIFYLPAKDGIEVVRVLHGARDLPGLFE
jgi:toxin ParE1/3/4